MSTIIKQTLKNKANDGHSSNSTDKGVLKTSHERLNFAKERQQISKERKNKQVFAMS